MISKIFSLLFGVGLIGFWLTFAEADADGPDYWAVQNVSQGSVLNLRKGPADQFAIVAHIPSNFSHLENLGCSPLFTDREWASFTPQERNVALYLRWCRVRYEGHVGWVKGEYLQEGLPPQK